ncbi:hypothetical protein KEM48_013300 [Puccinia striiformis f. sp. tritici PST-130]|nr:hypothetical protein KEM48_013300 [Puccinia striiformis f. sp. tritici PST-130]
MGCVGSKEIPEAQLVSLEIDKQIYKDKAFLRNEIKMLLLGAGEAGKSTILKQMRLIHAGSFTTVERDHHRELIFSNIIDSIQAILRAMRTIQIEFQDKSLEAAASMIESLSTSMTDHDMNTDVLCDSAAYYFDSIDRISQRNYIPDDQDILRSRLKTKGISETMFVIGDLNYRMLDVGGQRSERQKWIHCFENVTLIVFLAAISEYDQFLREENSVNRMDEALTLFGSISNSRCFNRSSSKQIYVHLTCATDTSQIRHVIGHVNDTIIQLNLSEYGMM